MTVKLNRQEHEITFRTHDGTSKVTGHIAEVNGLPLSIVMKTGNNGAVMVISDLKTGTRIKIVYISNDELLNDGTTKESSMNLFERKLNVFSLFLTDDVIEEIKVKRASFPEVDKPKPINYQAYEERNK